ncbi:DUF2911 domain-containing protein [Lutibacter sp.]|uniref:DUF2911 domain-containing protein n=1 Tax=Lutibacter sp. TaxID=1925666 RepID=UPI0027335483|nr:DUF2911 domain-containing protein [Lutibacter sp.]MDP3312018.1 DUF2911 domain-containing protein [Lutibacter sp.]
MRKIKFIILVTLCVTININAQEHNHTNSNPDKTEMTKKKPLSPHTSAMAMIGGAHIHIDYSSPSVRGRLIFGGLLPYNEVWQAGAHKATWIESNKDLIIKGKVIPAGKYGFFVIPGQKSWTIIFNNKWDQHGKDEYNENDDVHRFEIIPNNLNVVKDHLEYRISKKSETEGFISFAWEKIEIQFEFEIK